MRRTTASRSLNEFYRDDPDKADRLLFGRVTHPDRRGFLKNAGLAAMAALVGGTIPFHRTMPAHLIPVALADVPVIQGKDGLVVLNDRQLSAETPAHLLDDAVTPTERHFIRNNGIPPQAADASTWTLTVDGLSSRTRSAQIHDLKRRFDVVTRALTLDVRRTAAPSSTAGRRRRSGPTALSPCSEWTGVRLPTCSKARAGVKDTVSHRTLRGADTHPSGARQSELPISRVAVPLPRPSTPTP